MKAMKVVGTLTAKELEINKDSGAPTVGDVVTSMMVSICKMTVLLLSLDGKIIEIKTNREKDEWAKENNN